MRVGAAIRSISDRLAEAGVDEARLLTEYLLAEVTGRERLRLGEWRSALLTDRQESRLNAMALRMKRHEPLQYVLGHTEFFGRRFNTDLRALIPRPETEELVQRTLDEERLWEIPCPRIVDLGTGTGCIAITLALEHPEARTTAIDCCRPALDLARENADLHGIDTIEWVESDLLTARNPASADAIIGNPPYIASARIAELDRNVRDYEPFSALDGGPDGLRTIARILDQAAKVLAPDGWIFLEIGDEQGLKVSDLLSANQFREIRIEQDLAGRDRIAVGRRPAG